MGILEFFGYVFAAGIALALVPIVVAVGLAAFVAAVSWVVDR